MNPEEAAVQSADLANQPVAAFIKDGTVVEVVGTSALVAVDGGGEARPTILGFIPDAGQRVTILFDPASNGTCVILGTIGGATDYLDDLPTIDDPETTDYLAMVDADDDSSVKALVSDVLALIDPTDILELVYPVGHVYLSYVSINPATIFGFGTWTQIAEGEAIVGFKTSDTPFGTLGSIGAAGAKTIALSTAELAAHTHTGPSHTHTGPSHAHTGPTGSWLHYVTSGGSRADGGSGTGYDRDTLGSTGSAGTGDTGASGTGATGSTGSGTAHNNIQPSFVVYVWRRTA